MSSPVPPTSSVLTRLHPHAPAILIMVTALCLAALGGAVIKLLAGDMPPVLLAWFRFAIYGAILIPLAAWRGGKACLRPSRPLVQILRGLLLAAGNTAFLFGVLHVDYANAIAILYIYPFIMVGLSALILGEPVSRPAWIGVAGGFCGVLMVMRPDPATLEVGALFILVTGFTVALQLLLNRKLGSESDPLLVSMWGAVVAALALSLALPFTWQMPTADHLVLIGVVGGLTALSNTLMIIAMARAPAGQIAPFTYFEIIAGIVIGMVMFGTLPDGLSWAGMALIAVSGIAVKRFPGVLKLRRREKF
ncbi:MAG: DMT family transporter [Candidatus Puniceispirillaceae bacterium]